MLDELFHIKIRESLYGSVEVLQADLNVWLCHYGSETPSAPSRVSIPGTEAHHNHKPVRKPTRSNDSARWIVGSRFVYAFQPHIGTVMES